jgi:hypothetical protein
MKKAIAAALVTVSAGIAHAHITSTPDHAPANSHFIAHFMAAPDRRRSRCGSNCRTG